MIFPNPIFAPIVQSIGAIPIHGSGYIESIAPGPIWHNAIWAAAIWPFQIWA